MSDRLKNNGLLDCGLLVVFAGMAIAAPMHLEPLGRSLSDLPFVSALAQRRVHSVLRRVFSAPAEHGRVHHIMLHLRCQTGPVLLEVARRAPYTVVWVVRSPPCAPSVPSGVWCVRSPRAHSTARSQPASNNCARARVALREVGRDRSR